MIDSDSDSESDEDISKFSFDSMSANEKGLPLQKVSAHENCLRRITCKCYRGCALLACSTVLRNFLKKKTLNYRNFFLAFTEIFFYCYFHLHNSCFSDQDTKRRHRQES